MKAKRLDKLNVEIVNALLGYKCDLNELIPRIDNHFEALHQPIVSNEISDLKYEKIEKPINTVLNKFVTMGDNEEVVVKQKEIILIKSEFLKLEGKYDGMRYTLIEEIKELKQALQQPSTLPTQNEVEEKETLKYLNKALNEYDELVKNGKIQKNEFTYKMVLENARLKGQLKSTKKSLGKEVAKNLQTLQQPKISDSEVEEFFEILEDNDYQIHVEDKCFDWHTISVEKYVKGLKTKFQQMQQEIEELTNDRNNHEDDSDNYWCKWVKSSDMNNQYKQLLDEIEMEDFEEFLVYLVTVGKAKELYNILKQLKSLGKGEKI